MKSEVNAVMLFIAELTGSFVPGSGTEEDKIKCGQDDYIKNHLPVVELDSEDGRKDLHEVVWLERLYDELDEYFWVKDVPKDDKSSARALMLLNEGYRKESFKWNVPIELDASALA